MLSQTMQIDIQNGLVTRRPTARTAGLTCRVIIGVFLPDWEDKDEEVNIGFALLLSCFTSRYGGRSTVDTERDTETEMEMEMERDRDKRERETRER
jgi:hypothetical protein